VGPEKITCTGNMKFDRQTPLPSLRQSEPLGQFGKLSGRRRIFLAGSTHNGEEGIILSACSQMKKKFPDMLLVIAPRDPGRAAAVVDRFRAGGFSTVFMTRMNPGGTNENPDVIVVDVLGVLRGLYAFAHVAFVGGSLVNRGGHNPLEPAAVSKPVVFGPFMEDFRDISDMLTGAGGAVTVRDSASLCAVVSDLFENPRQAGQMGNKAFAAFAANQGAVSRTLDVIEECLYARPGRQRKTGNHQ
ncbi:MAG: hypothetical protein Q8P24_14590, partial [Desulfobacterales bacterium]|nr:hypothetical protein [Desulfobacterales bacterium]